MKNFRQHIVNGGEKNTSPVKLSSATTAADSASPAAGVIGEGQGFASNRLYRVMTVPLASTTLLMLVGTAGAIMSQSAVLTVPFTVFALLVLGVPSLCLVVLGFSAPRRTLQRLWQMQALGMVAIFLGITVVVPQGGIPEQMQLTWIGEFVVIAGASAMLVFTPGRAAIYAVVLSSVVFLIAVFWGSDGLQGSAVAAALRQIFYSAMFMCLPAALMRAGRILDETVDAAVVEARAQAEREARRSSQRAIRMLIHDSIIVAMLAYTTAIEKRSAKEQAREALRAIDRGLKDPDERRESSPEQLVRELRTLTTSLDPTARFHSSISGSDDYPHRAVRAVVESAAEALRNSVRHAPPEASVNREVHVKLSEELVEVLVLDDGPGFEPASIPSVRLGVRHGILGRMDSVPGGSAEVMSRLGYGTTVVLQWHRP